MYVNYTLAVNSQHSYSKGQTNFQKLYLIKKKIYKEILGKICKNHFCKEPRNYEPRMVPAINLGVNEIAYTKNEIHTGYRPEG